MISNHTNLLIGLNFKDAAHNPGYVSGPGNVDLGPIPQHLRNEAIETVVSAPNNGEQFNRTYVPYDGGNLGMILTAQNLDIRAVEVNGRPAIRLEGNNGTNQTYVEQ